MSILVPPRRVLLRGSRLLYPTYVQDYLDRVTAADVAAGNTLGLERGVTDAFNVALQSLVSAGQLGISANVIAQAASTIKAMPFLCGARTLSGILTPVVGPTPTNVNFVTADYNRRTGLGDPANVTKYLNANRANNADPQNNHSMSVFLSSVNASSPSIQLYIGTFAVGGADIGIAGNALFARSRSQTNNVNSVGTASTVGFIGTSRSNAANFVMRFNGADTTLTRTSEVPADGNTFVFRESGGTAYPTNARIAAYHIGQAIDLASLDAIQSTLISSLAAASLVP